MSDIDALKSMVSLVIQMCDSGYIMAQDGKLEWDDVGEVWDIMKKVYPAFKSVGEIPAEAAHLTPEQFDQLIILIESEFTIVPEKSKDVLDKILKAAKACHEVYLAVRVE